jgi:hypothetical protein
LYLFALNKEFLFLKELMTSINEQYPELMTSFNEQCPLPTPDPEAGQDHREGRGLGHQAHLPEAGNSLGQEECCLLVNRISSLAYCEWRIVNFGTLSLSLFI